MRYLAILCIDRRLRLRAGGAVRRALVRAAFCAPTLALDESAKCFSRPLGPLPPSRSHHTCASTCPVRVHARSPTVAARALGQKLAHPLPAHRQLPLATWRAQKRGCCAQEKTKPWRRRPTTSCWRSTASARIRWSSRRPSWPTSATPTATARPRTPRTTSRWYRACATTSSPRSRARRRRSRSSSSSALFCVCGMLHLFFAFLQLPLLPMHSVV